jgi:hypothetical protein
MKKDWSNGLWLWWSPSRASVAANQTTRLPQLPACRLPNHRETTTFFFEWTKAKSEQKDKETFQTLLLNIEPMTGKRRAAVSH